MKKFVLLLLICSPYVIHAKSINAPIDSVTKLITYSEVIFVDSTVYKKELFLRAKEWLIKINKTSENNIQFEDYETGKIIAKSSFTIVASLPIDIGTFLQPFGYVKFTISIIIKDFKYKYVMTNFIHYGKNEKDKDVESSGPCESFMFTGIKKYPEQTYKDAIYFLDVNASNFIKDFKKAMSGKSTINKDNNW